MQKSSVKNHLAVWALLGIILFSVNIRPAHAITFGFSGTCDAFCEVFNFGPTGSAVTGQLVLLDSVINTGPIFNNTDVVSLSLGFDLRDLIYSPPFSDSIGADGPVGAVTAGAASIEQIDIMDALGQTFRVDFGLEGSLLWSAIDTGGNRARGTAISFDVVPPPTSEIPEPGSMAMFMFAVGMIMAATRRRRGTALRRAI